jgi:hypothetical protein
MGGSFGGGGFGRGGFDGGHARGGGFDGGHERFNRGFSGFGFWPYDDYAYDYNYDNCYRTQRYHTSTGWHTRRVYACAY